MGDPLRLFVTESVLCGMLAASAPSSAIDALSHGVVGADGGIGGMVLGLVMLPGAMLWDTLSAKRKQ